MSDNFMSASTAALNLVGSISVQQPTRQEPFLGVQMRNTIQLVDWLV